MSDVLYKIKQLSKSREHEAFLDTLFGNHSRRVIKGAISVVLFGAGDVGRDLCEVLQLHGVQPKCFCDNNTSNVGTLLSKTI